MSEQRYYFDTSIWIDIHEKRGYHGEIAKKLMEKIIVEDGIVIYSDMIVQELTGLGFSENEILCILNIIPLDNRKRVHATKEQNQEARKFAKQRSIPLGDAVHAVLARDHEAQLVSRDRDFERLRDLIRCKPPEELV